MPIREEKDMKTKIGVNGPFLPVTEKQIQVGCERCGGFLVKDWVVSLRNDGGDVEILTHRCIQCGEVVDPVLLNNRLSTSSQIGRRGRAKPRKWVLAHSEDI